MQHLYRCLDINEYMRRHYKYNECLDSMPTDLNDTQIHIKVEKFLKECDIPQPIVDIEEGVGYLYWTEEKAEKGGYLAESIPTNRMQYDKELEWVRIRMYSLLGEAIIHTKGVCFSTLLPESVPIREVFDKSDLFQEVPFKEAEAFLYGDDKTRVIGDTF